LGALRQFTRLLVEQRGWVNEADARAFLSAGYKTQHILDIVVGIAQKTLPIILQKHLWMMLFLRLPETNNLKN